MAQFDCGQRHLGGFGVAQDPVAGFKWLLLAGAQGRADAKTKAESVQKGLSQAQISEAEQQAAAFIPRATAR